MIRRMGVVQVMESGTASVTSRRGNPLTAPTQTFGAELEATQLEGHLLPRLETAAAQAGYLRAQHANGRGGTALMAKPSMIPAG